MSDNKIPFLNLNLVINPSLIIKEGKWIRVQTILQFGYKTAKQDQIKLTFNLKTRVEKGIK